MNYKCIAKYDGTKYSGWQRLPEIIEKTIQGKIEIVLSRLLEENILIIGSGRTDAGVHAYMQVFNFKTDKKLDESFLEKLNNYLPEDIKIESMEQAEEMFHARYNAVSKTYLYKIDNSKYGDPFNRKFSYHVDKKLDVKKMREASKIFLGEHDFKTFSKNNSKKKSTVRTITSIEILEKENGMIELYFEGDGFLYNMVRMITGSLISVGLEKTTPEKVEKMLKEESREEHRFVVPPQGLYLFSVKY